MSRFGIGMLTLGAFGVAALVACADTEEENAGPPSEVPSSSGSLPNVDSGPSASDDAGTDADAEATAPIDAAPRVCSKEGFCHTALPPKQSLRGVWADGTGVAWAVTEEGNILRFDGTTWKVHVNVPGPLHAIWGSGPTDIWVGTTSGILHGTGASSDALVFAEVDTPKPMTAITSIWGTGPSDVWAVGGELSFPLIGRVLHWTGTDWALESITKEEILYMRVFGSDTSGLWLAGRRNNPEQFWFDVTLLHRPVGATEWESIALPLDPTVGDNPVGALENLYDATISADGNAVFVMGRTHSATPAFVRGVPVPLGQSWTWSFHNNGKFGEPESHAIVASTATDAFILGDYGRLMHLIGTTFKQSLITVDKFPVIDAFYASSGKWFVGDDIALFHDPAKAQP